MSVTTRIGLVGTAGYLPERWMPAAELGELSGIPEEILVERFGLRGKHIAAQDEHVSDMGVAAAERVVAESGVDPADIGAVVYFGSTFKDYPVWQAAPHIAHRLGCTTTFALELDYVSCGTPVALRVCRDLLVAEPHLGTVLAVAACRESALLDYTNERARFMFNFGDGAVAGLLSSESAGLDWQAEVLGSATVTDGSFSLDVKVPAGGSVEPASHDSVDTRRHYLDVADPQSMKERLDPVSLPRFLEVAEQALARSGAGPDDIDVLCGIHMKRSMHELLVSKLGVERAVYLDDTGHMSGVDPLFALDRAARQGQLADGDRCLLLAAGTGYTWAATVVRWGSEPR